MESRRLDDGVRPGRCVHEFGGIRANDSALAYLRLNAILRDEELTRDERIEVACRVILVDGGGFEQLSRVCEEAFGMSFGGEPDGTTHTFSWTQDAGRIRASLLQQYGVRWDDIAASTPMRDVYDMLSGLLESGDTPFSRAIHYRTARMPRGADAAAWMEAVRHFAIQDDDDPYGDKHMREVANG